MEIQSLNKLAHILRIPRGYLQELASRRKDCYRPYTQRKIKKDGSIKLRRIDNPNDELKEVQRKINECILTPMINKLPDFIHGARHKKSIRTNAEPHAGQGAILSLDLENCFPNISASMVYAFFRNECKFIPVVAKVITKLTTYNNSLPQGSPTSASLCNLIMYPMLQELSIKCNKKHLKLTQFIDDIFISGELNTVKNIRRDACSIIERHGFKCNKRKNKVTTQRQAMIVAGVTVNRKTSIGREKKHRIEREIMKLDCGYHTEVRDKNGKLRKVYDHERLQGRIASVCNINEEQGRKLQQKFDRKRRMAVSIACCSVTEPK